MKALAGILIVTLTAVAQDKPQDNPPQEKSPQDKTAIEVKPAEPVIKQADLWEQNGVLHPFHRMPRFVCRDEMAIWTSPFHTAKSDIKWWAIFGAATAALIATDRYTAEHLPNSPTQVSISTWGSRFGSGYFLVPVSAGFYFIGSAQHDQRFRETGLVAFETLIDVNLTNGVLKLIFNRARPTEGNEHGRFETGVNRWSSSFPSGHAMNTWAMASVIAHEYPRPLVKILVYGLASTVVISRVGARRHFPGDVVAGGGLGWFMGDYIYGKRHNRALDAKPSALNRVLDHVHFGASLN